MGSTDDPRPNSQSTDLSKGQQPRELPSHNAVTSLCSLLPHSGSSKDVLFKSSTFAVRQQTEITSSYQGSTANDVGLSQTTDGLPASPIDQDGPRTSKRKLRSDLQLDDLKAAKVSWVGKICHDADSIISNLPGCGHRAETSNQSKLNPGHAVKNRSRHRAKEETQRTSSSDTDGADLRLISDLRRMATPQQNDSLLTPPDSDTGLDRTKWYRRSESIKSNGIPSYRFVPIPESVTDIGTSSIDLQSLQSLSACTYPDSEQRSSTPTPALQRNNVTSLASTLPSTTAPEFQSIKRTAPSARERPLLNFVWRDIGNGISRAYPRNDLPPLPSPTLPSTLPQPIEGWDYFIESDDDTTMSQCASDEDTNVKNTTNHKDSSLPNDPNTQVPSCIPSTHQEPVDIVSRDSEVEHRAPESLRLPTYRFIATPPPSTDQFDGLCELSDIHTICDSGHHFNHILDGPIPSNVQPTHLTTHCLSSPSGIPPHSPEISQYNPSTSSGFSDTDPDLQSNNNKPSNLRKPNPDTVTCPAHKQTHQHKTRRKTTTKTKSTPLSSASFTRTAVLHAAARLTKSLDRKAIQY